MVYVLVCNNTVLIQIWSMQECMHHVLTGSELVALLEETRHDFHLKNRQNMLIQIKGAG